MTRGVRILPAAALALLVATAAFAGYHQIFSTLAPYDDEGYVMLGVVNYLRGLPLYEEIYTQYGPALFALEGGFHRLTGLPVTQDVVRLRTIAVWLATALLCAAAVGRITGSRSMGAAAFLAVFLHLERLCLEPGHPQELCVLFTVAAVTLMTYLPQAGGRAWIPLAVGVLVGLVMMTKLNLGVFLLAGVCLATFLEGPKTWCWRTAAWLVFPSILALPLALVGARLAEPASWPLPAAVLSGAAGVMLVARSRGSCHTEFRRDEHRTGMCRTRGWIATGTVAACVVVAGVVLSRGVSLDMLWYGLVGQHRGFSDGPFYNPAPLPNVGPVVAIAGVLSAWLARSGGIGPVRLARGLVAFVVFSSVFSYVRETSAPLLHGLIDRGGAGLLVAVAAPLAWIILTPWKPTSTNRTTTPARGDFGRLALACVAVFQPLGAFPIPGTQMAVCSAPLLLVALVAIYDFVAARDATAVRPRESAGAIPTRTALSRASGRLQTTVAGALTLILFAVLVYRGFHLRSYRESLTPLNLRGATLLRAPAATVAQQRRLVEILQRRADTFVFGEDTHNRVYFWTGLEPPSALSATVWPYLLRPEQQQRVVEALRRRDRVWLVRDEYNRLTPPANSPLAKFLDENFRLHSTQGRYQLWVQQVSGSRTRAASMLRMGSAAPALAPGSLLKNRTRARRG